MKDMLDNTLAVGDKVAFAVTVGSSSAQLRVGKVEAFTDARVRVRYTVRGQNRSKLEVASNIVRLPPGKPASEVLNGR